MVSVKGQLARPAEEAGAQLGSWAPGHQHSISAPPSFTQGEELELKGSGPVPMGGCAAPLIFPGTKSPGFASSLIQVPWMSKESIWGIPPQLSACASHEGGSIPPPLGTRWDGPSTALEVQYDK